MTDIVEFLTARLDEDEAAARAATPGPWRWGDWSSNFGTLEQERNALECAPGYGDFPVIRQRGDDPVGVLRLMDSLEVGGGDGDYLANGDHIARHDPARVLAEVAAKRKIVMEYATALHLPDAVFAGTERAAGFQLALEMACRALAAPYAEHPDYDPAWRVE